MLHTQLAQGGYVTAQRLHEPVMDNMGLRAVIEA